MDGDGDAAVFERPGRWIWRHLRPVLLIRHNRDDALRGDVESAAICISSVLPRGVVQ